MWFRHLSVNEQAAPWGVQIAAAGFGVVGTEAAYPPVGLYPPEYSFSWRFGRTISHYKIVYIVRGRGEYESVNGNVQAIVPGTLLLITPGSWYRYRPRPDTGWTEYWLVLSGDYLARLTAGGALSPGRIVVGDEFRRGEILICFQQMMRRLGAAGSESSPMLAASVVTLLAAAAGSARTAPAEAEIRRSAGEASQAVMDAVSLIRNGIPTQSVDDIVTQLPVSRRTLERCFREHLGHGIHHAIVAARVERAQRLLQYPYLSLDEVAAQAGFPDVRTMRRAFRAVTGISPNSYRVGLSANAKPAARVPFPA